MQALLPRAVHPWLDHSGQEGRVPGVPGEGGHEGPLRRQALGDTKPVMDPDVGCYPVHDRLEPAHIPGLQCAGKWWLAAGCAGGSVLDRTAHISYVTSHIADPRAVTGSQAGTCSSAMQATQCATYFVLAWLSADGSRRVRILCDGLSLLGEEFQGRHSASM